MRLPRGYIGTDHETIGADILSVVQSLRTPDAVFDGATLDRLGQIDAVRWYPVARLLELTDLIEERLGRYALLRTGRMVFKLSHEAEMRRVARSARDVIHGLDVFYRRSNRGHAIGGWTVLDFRPGHAEIEKTTPQHCAMEEGIILEALRAVAVPAIAEETACFRKGSAPACRFILSSAIVDERWTGKGASHDRNGA
jgi:hypothetical protein